MGWGTYFFDVDSSIQSGSDQTYRGFLNLSVLTLYSRFHGCVICDQGVRHTSACLFKFIGTRLNIPAEIPCGESVVDE